MSKEAAMLYLIKRKQEIERSHNPNDCQRKRSSRRLCIIIGILFVISILAVSCYVFWLYYAWF